MSSEVVPLCPAAEAMLTGRCVGGGNGGGVLVGGGNSGGDGAYGSC